MPGFQACRTPVLSPATPHLAPDIAATDPAWHAAWRDLRLSAPAPAVFDELVGRWAEPHRRYHTLQHLRECLTLFEQLRDDARHPGEIAIALWFHDAVYDTSRHDNEAASADWAGRALLDAGASAQVAQRVHALIMATRHAQVPATADAQLLVDIDLAILGAPPGRFDEYERQIRAEYAFVPEALFREKRGAVLRGFLQRPTIFATAACRQRFEATARSNLAKAIASLD